MQSQNTAQLIVTKMTSCLSDSNFHFFLFSFAIMLFATHSSPLYTFNQWNDINIHYTIGKGLFNGYVHMVDLIDNKGPVIHFLYGLAWLIDKTGHTGVYVLLSIFLAVSMIYVNKLAHLFIKRNDICFFVAILSSVPLLIFRRSAFLNSGGSIEEFTLSIFTVSLYYFTLYFMKPDFYRHRNVFLLGILFAAVFMMKFNLATFFLGFLLVIFCKLLIENQFAALLRYTLYFLGGTLTIIFPYFIYTLANNSLKAFIHTYFLLSSNYLVEGMSIGMNFATTFSNANLSLLHLGFVFIALAGILFSFRYTNAWFAFSYSLSMILLFFFIYLGDVYTYTHIPLFVFLLMLIIMMGMYFEKMIVPRKEAGRIVQFAAVCIIFVAIVWMNGLEKSSMFLHRTTPVQIQMAEIINSLAKDGSPTLLQAFGMDYGFYTATGIIPDEPYFSDLNISDEILPEMRISKQIAVREGKYEFVILPTPTDSYPDEDYWSLDHYEHVVALLDDEGTLWHLFKHL